MRLVIRRAGEAKGLLLAAGAAALVAVAMVTGLMVYSGNALEAGKRSAWDAAGVDERSLLITGSIPPGGFAERDAAVRDAFADGLGERPVTVAHARSGTGRQLIGDLGEFAPADEKPIFASMVTLGNLAEHADLVDGAWPQNGGRPIQVALPDAVAAGLGVTVGDRIPMMDRATEQRTEVTVAGIWRPRDLLDPYWRLVPELTADRGTATTIGPFVLDPADFDRTYSGSTSAAWLIEPDLRTATVTQMGDARRDADRITAELPEQARLGASGRVATRIGEFIDRLDRAELAGRSALLTPVLLIAVLSGYALLLIAVLLNEDRRMQTALLRARGAARRQIAGLAVREAALVVLPVAVLAPMLVSQALGYVDRNLAPTELGLDAWPSLLAWLVAGIAAGGCLLAMVGPALRRAGTYLEELTTRSRPTRWAVAQRASVDLALVGLAVLAWFQLRQYSSPLAGVGIDPLLTAAPTLGILAGGVIALRLLPPVTRFTERFVTDKQWTATVFGMWQAGRRPHAGPVLLLALAVGASTLAWSLITTWRGSLHDQADHQVGADLRVTEIERDGPADRAAELAMLPGVRTALPAWRDEVHVGELNLATTVVALDAATAAEVVRLNADLVDGTPAELFEQLAADRVTAPGSDLPAEARQLTGTLRTPAARAHERHQVRTEMLISGPNGQIYRMPISTTNDGAATRFTVDLPDIRPLRLAGFRVTTPDAGAESYGFELTDLQVVTADGAETPLDLGAEQWRLADQWSTGSPFRPSSPNSLSVTTNREQLGLGWFGQPLTFTLTRVHHTAPVPAAVTPEVLDELPVEVGKVTQIGLFGARLDVLIVGVVDAVPSAGNNPAMLLDLPSAATILLHEHGRSRPTPEWWLDTDPDRHDEAAEAVRHLTGLNVLDRHALAAEADGDPYWQGARTGLLAAALGTILFAVVGLLVDVWATARRRIGELAVLHTLGATPRLLARALIAEQAFLAGIGVTVGLVIGAGVGATMAPLVILTPAADRPVPAPAFELAGRPVAATAAGLLLVALVLSGFIAVTVRRRLAATQLRIGADR